MSRIYLVRHGRAAAGWDDDPDPGLDDLGRDQAARTAARLAEFGPMSLVSSPLRRCRETAGFLAEVWSGATVEIEERVSEIPSPDGVPLGQRLPWLRTAMAGSWQDLGERYTTFRDAVVTFVSSRPTDTVIFSHFIAINAVIGACLNDDRLVIDSLDNASVTVVDTGNPLRLVERGRQADTLIR